MVPAFCGPPRSARRVFRVFRTPPPPTARSKVTAVVPTANLRTRARRTIPSHIPARIWLRLRDAPGSVSRSGRVARFGSRCFACFRIDCFACFWRGYFANSGIGYFAHSGAIASPISARPSAWMSPRPLRLRFDVERGLRTPPPPRRHVPKSRRSSRPPTSDGDCQAARGSDSRSGRFACFGSGYFAGLATARETDASSPASPKVSVWDAFPIVFPELKVAHDSRHIVPTISQRRSFTVAAAARLTSRRPSPTLRLESLYRHPKRVANPSSGFVAILL